MSSKSSHKTRFIFITGGVVSSLGKGLASASIAALLQARGYRVRLRKLDPYLNVDPGTMNPYQHGEVFVTEDGAETDLDLGHYERFTGVDARRADSATAGQIYSTLLSKERRGDYLGGTVQVIPNVTDIIKTVITRETENEDFVFCEIGGTVGDIEGQPFLEAIRQLGYEMGRDKVMFIHLTLVPYLKAAGELKTKPTQHSVKELRTIGIQPDILLCRAERKIPQSDLNKIAQFCNVKESCVFEALDANSIYSVPLDYSEQGVDVAILNHFRIEPGRPDLSRWKTIAERFENPAGEITIAIVGKYVALKDAYKSLSEAIFHAGIANNLKVRIEWVDARTGDDATIESLKKAQAILVPGGFGESGVDGKLAAIRFARENKIPYLGICFGMQMAVVEFARNVLGIKNASSTEFGPCDDAIVGLMTEWLRGNVMETRKEQSDLGGTMRLGSYECTIQKDSLAEKVYGTDNISERHRHRYEVNINYRDKLEQAGMVMSGLSPCGNLPEIVELKDHPWFIGVQFHPELKSRPFAPHPLFTAFIEAAAKVGVRVPQSIKLTAVKD